MDRDPESPRPASYATLAKRISTWTTNSVLTLLVLVAGLGFGRQVLLWWKADDPASTAPPPIITAAGDDDPDQPQTIRLGDDGRALRRQILVGDKNKAIATLRAICRRATETAKPIPADETEAAVRAKGQQSPQAKPTAETDKFLAFLAHAKPVASEPGKWRLYESSDVVPMAAGLIRTTVTPTADEKRPGDGANLADLGYRVVIWGLAMPSGPNQWTLWTLEPRRSSGQGAGSFSEIPIPPESSRTLSLEDDRGGGMAAFAGPDRPDRWQRFYDDWFAHQAWKPVVPWQALGNGRYARFLSPDGRAVDVRFAPDGQGRLSGLLVLSRGEPK